MDASFACAAWRWASLLAGSRLRCSQSLTTCSARALGAQRAQGRSRPERSARLRPSCFAYAVQCRRRRAGRSSHTDASKGQGASCFSTWARVARRALLKARGLYAHGEQRQARPLSPRQPQPLSKRLPLRMRQRQLPPPPGRARRLRLATSWATAGRARPTRRTGTTC